MTQPRQTAYAVALRHNGQITLAPLAKSPECAIGALSPFEGAQVVGLVTVELEPITGMQYVLREIGPSAKPVVLAREPESIRLRQENARLWDRLRAPRGSHEPPARNPPPLTREPSTPSAHDYVPGELDRTAPARIWLQIDTSGDNAERDEPWPGADHVTWQDESIGGLEIQYVRADLATPSARVSGERAVFNCHRCPVSVVESSWLPPECPECGDPCELDVTAKVQVSGGGGALRERLVECRDWFEAQAKVISKGNGSTWDLMQVREQRDLCDTALSTPQARPDGGEAFDMLVRLARAAHLAMDDGEDTGNGVVSIPSLKAQEISDALEAMESLPEIPDPHSVYAGWARAEYFARHPTPAPDVARLVEALADEHGGDHHDDECPVCEALAPFTAAQQAVES